MAFHSESRGPDMRMAMGMAAIMALPFGIAVHERLVATHPGHGVDVAGLGHPHHRVEEQRRPGRLGGLAGQLEMGPVHRVTGVEGDDAVPPPAGELGPHLERPRPHPAEVR